MVYMVRMPKRSGIAHVATTRRTYKGKVYETHLLRRTYREGRQVKHETLGNLSHLPPDLIDIIRSSLAGERYVRVEEAFAIERSLPHGHVEAVLGTIRKLGLDQLIASKRSRERDLVVAMIAHRLISPASKLAATRQWHQTTLAEEMGVSDADEDDLYRALDWLLVRQEGIEKKLSARHLTECGRALYDVTSSYYEGRHCVLARYGHNRDGKRENPIIVYGVMTDREGRPVAMEAYPGNTADPATVPDQVTKLRERFGLEHVTLVGDRGMLTAARIEALKEYPGLGWVSALRSMEIRKLVTEGALQLSLFDKKNLAEISSPEFPGERLVACFNPLLAEERGRKREELLAATEKDLGKIAVGVRRRTRTPMDAKEIGLRVGRVVNAHKMAKHFDLAITDGSFRFSRKEDSIRREILLDGIYVIRTSEPTERRTPEDTVRDYKGLATVERAFRCMKGIDILVRPIFHRTEDHVKAHLFLCLLAYYVEWHMRKALAPLLFEDEELDEDRKTRDPVRPAESSASVKRKKATKMTPDGFPVQSFSTLLSDLATRCRNLCRVKSRPNSSTFHELTQRTPLQERTFQLLDL
jgi:transposase